MIEPSAFLVSKWKLQAFFTPKPFDLLVIDFPALDTKQFRDLAVAIPTVLLGQPDQGQSQCIVISSAWLILQGAPRQTDKPARPSL